MVNWGSCFLSHYERFLRPPVAHKAFTGLAGEPFRIQVLAFDKVFPRCRVFATLGLSHYSSEVGNRCELVIAADDGVDLIPRILANIAFFLIGKKMHIGRGVAVDGVEAIDPGFSMKFGKSGVYFADPVLFPAAFRTVHCDTTTAAIYLGVWITPSEYQYFSDRGAVQFERLMEQSSVDPFDLGRKSAV